MICVARTARFADFGEVIVAVRQSQPCHHKLCILSQDDRDVFEVACVIAEPKFVVAEPRRISGAASLPSRTMPARAVR